MKSYPQCHQKYDEYAHLKAAWEAGKRIRVKGHDGCWLPFCKKGEMVWTWRASADCYEIEPDQPTPIIHNGVEYIPHKPGDPCPVDEGTVVEVLLQDGAQNRSIAEHFYWEAGEGRGDAITGYRVITSTPADSPAQAAPAESTAQKGVWQQRYDEMIVTCAHKAKERDEALARAEAAEARVKSLEACLFQMQEVAKNMTSHMLKLGGLQ